MLTCSMGALRPATGPACNSFLAFALPIALSKANPHGRTFVPSVL